LRRVLTVLGAAGAGLGRLALGVVCYPAELVRTTGRAWHRFFFTPADPTPLALIRIGAGLLALWNFWTLGLDLRSNLGSDGWADPATLRVFWKEWKRETTPWSLWLLIPDHYLNAAWVVSAIILVLFTLGLASRVTAVLSWLIVVSTVRRAPVLFFGFDQVLSAWIMYLAVCGASGQALSLDRLRRGRRLVPTVSANLGLRLIQLHLCLIYAVSGLSKLQGQSWWNGEAVLMILVAPEYTTGRFLWLAAYPRFLNFLTHATVALEILYPILIWVRILRPLMLLGMVLLHVGIDQTLGLTEFSLAMITGNLAFVAVPGPRGRSEEPEVHAGGSALADPPAK
jgi:hypothetical protein